MDREKLTSLKRNLRDLDIAMEAIDYVRADLDSNFDDVLKPQTEELRKMHRQLMQIYSAIWDVIDNNGGAE